MNCPITLTPKAIKMVKEFISKENGTILRIGCKGGGCSGYTYLLEIIENSTNRDIKFEQDGLQMVIDPISIQYLKGTTIDWMTKGLQLGFTFKNPNSKATCGCGESFST